MLTDLVLRLRALFGRKRNEREIDEELRFISTGRWRCIAAPDSITTRRYAGHVSRFGGLDQVKEDTATLSACV